MLTAQKMKFISRISSVNVTMCLFPTDLVTFTEEILEENFIFCSSYSIVAMSYGFIYHKLCFTKSLIIVLIPIFCSILFFHLKYIKNDTPTIQLYLRSLELTKIYLGRASDNCSQWSQRNGSWS